MMDRMKEWINDIIYQFATNYVTCEQRHWFVIFAQDVRQDLCQHMPTGNTRSRAQLRQQFAVYAAEAAVAHHQGYGKRLHGHMSVTL